MSEKMNLREVALELVKLASHLSVDKIDSNTIADLYSKFYRCVYKSETENKHIYDLKEYT